MLLLLSFSAGVVLSVVLYNASLSDSCKRVCVSLVHYDVGICRADPPIRGCRGSTTGYCLPNSGSFGLRVDYESDPRGSAYRLPPARLLTSHATRAAGTRPSSACVEPLRRPLAVTAEWADSSASE